MTSAMAKVKNAGRGKYGFLYQNGAGVCATPDKVIGTDARLLLVCLARANNSGHAIFDPGELAKKLARPNRTTGEIQPLHRSSVTDAINRAIQAGWCAPVSTARCVLVVSDLWTRRFGGTPGCNVHKTRAPWRGDDFGEAPEPDSLPA